MSRTRADKGIDKVSLSTTEYANVKHLRFAGSAVTDLTFDYDTKTATVTIIGGGGQGLTNAWDRIKDSNNNIAQAQGGDIFLLEGSTSVSVSVNPTSKKATFTVLPSGVDHNLLANLTTGDPHTQYTLKTRTIATTAPLTGGGNLSADRTISITGLSTLGSANQLAGVNSGATAWEYKTLSGTTGEINVTHGAGTITLSLPNVGTAGTYTKVTTDAKGRVSSGGQAQFSDIGGTASKTQLPSSVAYEDEANTFTTGIQRFDSTIVIPRKTDPTTPNVGELWVNVKDLKYRDNQATPTTHIVEVQDNKGVANGYCDLDANGKVPVARVTEVIDLSKLTDVGDVATNKAKGDILVCNGTSYQRLGVGADGQVLTADSAQSLGVKWATVGAGGGSIVKIASTLTTITTLQDSTSEATIFEFLFTPDFTTYPNGYWVYIAPVNVEWLARITNDNNGDNSGVAGTLYFRNYSTSTNFSSMVFNFSITAVRYAYLTTYWMALNKDTSNKYILNVNCFGKIAFIYSPNFVIADSNPQNSWHGIVSAITTIVPDRIKVTAFWDTASTELSATIAQWRVVLYGLK